MNKRLGQHFLINKSAIKKIIAALDLQKNETVIEIGPGEGALTLPLLEEREKLNCKIIGIEKDQQLAKKLGSNIKLPISNFQIIEGDALKILPPIIHNSSFMIQNYKIIGNIPYYITGKLLRIISELELKPALTVLMIQKEVAERVSAKPPKMNLLAAATQIWAEPKILFSLKPRDFNPPPKVDSTVIRLKPHTITDNQETIISYYKMIKVIFKQPRKTLLNNLTTGLKIPKNGIEKILGSLKIDPNARPQDLSLEKLKELTGVINS